MDGPRSRSLLLMIVCLHDHDAINVTFRVTQPPALLAVVVRCIAEPAIDPASRGLPSLRLVGKAGRDREPTIGVLADANDLIHADILDHKGRPVGHRSRRFLYQKYRRSGSTF